MNSLFRHIYLTATHVCLCLTCHRQHSSMINLKSKELLKLEINDLYVHINFVRKRLNAIVYIMNTLKIDFTMLENFKNFIKSVSKYFF